MQLRDYVLALLRSQRPCPNPKPKKHRKISHMSSLVLLLLQKTGTLRHAKLVIFLTRIFRPRRRQVLGVTIPNLDEWPQTMDACLSSRAAEKLGEFTVPKTSPLATVIVSAFRSEDYLDRFIANLLEQEYIEHCEVVIVLSDPSQAESSIFRHRLGHLPFVRLIEIEGHLSIYQSWNLAIKQSSSPYITNMNVDDFRHPQSLAIQISEAYASNADVVWQDFYLNLDFHRDWETIKSVGLRSNLSSPSVSSLSRGINAPHNAPMWSRELHTRLGYFDETLTSGADHDFWIRAAIAEARFHKSAHVHVSYFYNPKGMSTKLGSPSTLEGMGILHKYRKQAKFFASPGKKSAFKDPQQAENSHSRPA